MLSQIYLSKCQCFKISLAFTIAALLITGFACGKRKPPLPPLQRNSSNIEISGFQQGSVIILSWTLPDRNADDSSLTSIRRANVYRLAEPLSAPESISENEFATRATLIANVAISDSNLAKQQFTYRDTLQFAGQSARLRYAVRFVNEAGQKAAFSNFLLIEPTAKLAGTPTTLTARLTQEAVLLIWTSPPTNVDGSQPVNLLGFNLYRTVGATTKLLNETPINGTQFADNFFKFGTDYRYFVRSVSLGTNGNPVESLNSNEVELSTVDVFPPAPPTAITIAAAPRNLAIFFATNIENDVVGYRIYRSTDARLPKSDWKLLTGQLLTTNTFQDKSVESGQTYYYYLTAEDSAGNVSQPSEIVSETAP